jgi:hypothetical protein
MSKINYPALQHYSQSFAKKICDDFFQNNTVATGPQILKLTTIPQVNLLVISSIYEKWKADAVAFRSTYFDFESESVKTAMQLFMNTVSQYIAVKAEHLELLVAHATQDSLSLLIDPKTHFNDMLRSQPDFVLTAETISQLQKYTKFNQFIPKYIADKMAGQSFVYINQAVVWLDGAITENSTNIENTETWVAEFSKTVPINIDEIIKKSHKDILLSKLEESTTEGQSFFDSIAITTHSAEPLNAGLQNILASKEINTEESLNDSLKTDEDNLAEMLQKQSITSITDNIPLHQKFMFTHQLFGGSMVAYDKMITELEQVGNYDDARELVTYTYANQHGWDASSEAVSALIDVLKRRFN